MSSPAPSMNDLETSPPPPISGSIDGAASDGGSGQRGSLAGLLSFWGPRGSGDRRGSQDSGGLSPPPLEESEPTSPVLISPPTDGDVDEDAGLIQWQARQGVRTICRALKGHWRLSVHRAWAKWVAASVAADLRDRHVEEISVLQREYFAHSTNLRRIAGQYAALQEQVGGDKEADADTPVRRSAADSPAVTAAAAAAAAATATQQRRERKRDDEQRQREETERRDLHEQVLRLHEENARLMGQLNEQQLRSSAKPLPSATSSVSTASLEGSEGGGDDETELASEEEANGSGGGGDDGSSDLAAELGRLNAVAMAVAARVAGQTAPDEFGYRTPLDPPQRFAQSTATSRARARERHEHHIHEMTASATHSPHSWAGLDGHEGKAATSPPMVAKSPERRRKDGRKRRSSTSTTASFADEEPVAGLAQLADIEKDPSVARLLQRFDGPIQSLFRRYASPQLPQHLIELGYKPHHQLAHQAPDSTDGFIADDSWLHFARETKLNHFLKRRTLLEVFRSCVFQIGGFDELDALGTDALELSFEGFVGALLITAEAIWGLPSLQATYPSHGIRLLMLFAKIDRAMSEAGHGWTFPGVHMLLDQFARKAEEAARDKVQGERMALRETVLTDLWTPSSSSSSVLDSPSSRGLSVDTMSSTSGFGAQRSEVEAGLREIFRSFCSFRFGASSQRMLSGNKFQQMLRTFNVIGGALAPGTVDVVFSKTLTDAAAEDVDKAMLHASTAASLSTGGAASAHSPTGRRSSVGPSHAGGRKKKAPGPPPPAPPPGFKVPPRHKPQPYINYHQFKLALAQVAHRKYPSVDAAEAYRKLAMKMVRTLQNQKSAAEASSMSPEGSLADPESESE